MALSTRQKIILFFLFMSCFFNNLAIGVFPPTLPRENDLRGYGSTITGLMFGLTPFTVIFCNILAGTLAIPKFGVHNVLKGGAITLAISTGLFACMELIPHNASFTYLITGFILRFLLGAGSCGIFISAQTYLTETVPQASTLLLSILGAIGGVGSITGPAIAGGLFKAGGFWLVYAAPGLVILIFGVAVCIWLPAYEQNVTGFNDQEKTAPNTMQNETAFHGKPKEKTAVTTTPLERSILYKRILLNRRVLLGLFVTMFSAIAWYALDPILEPELRKTHGLSAEMSSLVFLLLPSAFVIMAPIAGRFVGKSKHCPDSLIVMIFGFAVLVVTFLLCGPAPFLPIPKRLWLLLVCLTVSGFANSWIYVPGQDIMFDVQRLKLAHEGDTVRARAFISGCWNACYASGICLGMVISGIIQEATSWSWVTTFYAIGSFLLIILVALVKLSEVVRCCNNRVHGVGHTLEKCERINLSV